MRDHRKTLIVYYSLTGTTKKLAERMAGMMKCDAEKLPAFGTKKLDAKDKFDLIVVGTPTWFYGPGFMVSRFLSRNRDVLPKVAFFCTYQTTIGKSFEKMERKCGKKPSGTLKLTGPEIGTEAGDTQLKQFVGQISR